MFEAPAKVAPARPDPKDMRLLTCRRCFTVVEVFELPVRYLDQASYVCGQCEVGG